MRESGADTSALPGVRCYVALGDSSSRSSDVGGAAWPDLLARALGGDVRYENLAAAGAKAYEVEQRQLPGAIALSPDLVSIYCGANDVLSSLGRGEGDYRECLARVLSRIATEAPRARTFTATYPDPTRFMAVRPRTRLRLRRAIQTLNEATRRISARHGALCLDWAEHPAVMSRAHFGPDGFHPAPELHGRAAAYALDALRDWLPTDRGERAA